MRRSDAMRGLATANREDKPAEREQEIYTGEDIVRVLKRVWPRGIALDPCSGPLSIVNARESWQGTKLIVGRRGDGSPITKWLNAPGLTQSWKRFTYANPPFDNLRFWLAKAMREAKRLQLSGDSAELMVLGPVRTNRGWYRAAWKHASARGALDPLVFGGYKDKFPAPCALLYWGEHVEEFTQAMRGIGECL